MPKTKPSTSLTKWDQRLADLAKQAKTQEARVGTGANFLSFKGGILSFQKGAMPENKMKCIIIDSVLEKQYFEGKYDPENPSSPNCYAFARDVEALAPNPENVEKPMAEACAACELNQWGSAEVGRGKACNDVRRLALVPQSEMDNLASPTVAYAKIPATSLTYWAGYVRQLQDVYNKPPLAFVTELSIVREQTTKLPGWHVEFKMLEEIDDPEAFEALMALYDRVSKEIDFPYPKLTQIEAPANGKARKVAPPAAKRPPAQREPVAPIATATAAAGGGKVGLRRAAKATKY